MSGNPYTDFDILVAQIRKVYESSLPEKQRKEKIAALWATVERICGVVLSVADGKGFTLDRSWWDGGEAAMTADSEEIGMNNLHDDELIITLDEPSILYRFNAK